MKLLFRTDETFFKYSNLKETGGLVRGFTGKNIARCRKQGARPPNVGGTNPGRAAALPHEASIHPA